MPTVEYWIQLENHSTVVLQGPRLPFTTAGTFNYHCGFHTGMLGTLTVSA